MPSPTEGRQDHSGKIAKKTRLGASRRLRIRHGSSARYDTEFDENQQWVKISGKVKLDFINENPNLEEFYANITTTGIESLRARSLSLVDEHLDNGSSTTKEDVNVSSPRSSLSWTTECDGVMNHAGTATRDRSSGREIETDQTSEFELEKRTSTSNSHHTTLGNTANSMSWIPHTDDLSSDELHGAQNELQIPLLIHSDYWPNMSVEEAYLMRHYIDNLGSWFDMCDPERHFTLIVPQRANHCPALLYAIYAASARHLSRLKQDQTTISYLGRRIPNIRADSAVEYHTRCIEQLVTLSDHPHAAFDENLLAASVILRLYEELDAPFNGGDWETSLWGTQVFLDAQADARDLQTGLRSACFRVAYRQEVQLAFIKQRCLHLPLAYCDPYRSLEPADDYTWAHRIVVHCADILTYCYGDQKTSYHDYDMLADYLRAWQELRPQSFSPIFFRYPATDFGEIFPEMMFLSDCQVTGIQHFELANILLTVYNPRIPKLGFSHMQALKSIEGEVIAIIRRLCGTAISNSLAPPAMNTACVAIAVCGELFMDRLVEQQAILDMLQYSDTKHAWPTADIQEQLKNSWKWHLTPS